MGFPITKSVIVQSFTKLHENRSRTNKRTDGHWLKYNILDGGNNDRSYRLHDFTIQSFGASSKACVSRRTLLIIVYSLPYLNKFLFIRLTLVNFLKFIAEVSYKLTKADTPIFSNILSYVDKTTQNWHNLTGPIHCCTRCYYCERSYTLFCKSMYIMLNVNNCNLKPYTELLSVVIIIPL